MAELHMAALVRRHQLGVAGLRAVTHLLEGGEKFQRILRVDQDVGLAVGSPRLLARHGVLPSTHKHKHKHKHKLSASYLGEDGLEEARLRDAEVGAGAHVLFEAGGGCVVEAEDRLRLVDL